MSVLIIGSGGHAKVVIDALMAGSPECGLIIRDGNPERSRATILGHSIETPELPASLDSQEVHVAIGNGAVRQRLLLAACAKGGRAYSVLHPDASIAKGAVLGDGCFVAAGAVVGPDASIGSGCIINHRAVVDHDCILGEFSHIGPGATLGGGVQIGALCDVGAGANILPGVVIGDGTVIGAGAVVTASIAGGGTWAGVPARLLK